MVSLLKCTKCLIILYCLCWASQAHTQAQSISTAFYYTTKQNRSLLDILSEGLRVPKSFLKNEGRTIVNNIKNWNPHIKNWDPVATDQKIYLEFPKKYSFLLRSENKKLKKSVVQKKRVVKRSVATQKEEEPVKKEVKVEEPVVEIKDESHSDIGFMEMFFSSQKGSYEDETPGGSRIDTERGALGVGTHVVLKWKPEHKNFVYGDLAYNQSGSVTVGESNTSFSTPNTWLVGAGLHMPELLFDWDFEIGLERKEISYLSWDKQNINITKVNAANFLFGLKGTFYNLKLRGVIPYILFDNEAQINMSYVKSFIGSGKLDSNDYSPTLSLSGYRFGIRQGIWKRFFIEGGYETNIVNEEKTDTNTTETVLLFNIGSVLDI